MSWCVASEKDRAILIVFDDDRSEEWCRSRIPHYKKRYGDVELVWVDEPPPTISAGPALRKYLTERN